HQPLRTRRYTKEIVGASFVNLCALRGYMIFWCSGEFRSQVQCGIFRLDSTAAHVCVRLRWRLTHFHTRPQEGTRMQADFSRSRIAVLGAGKMGGILVKALLEKHQLLPERVRATVAHESR